jgi:hypothetical protein
MDLGGALYAGGDWNTKWRRLWMSRFIEHVYWKLEQSEWNGGLEGTRLECMPRWAVGKLCQMGQEKRSSSYG